MESKFSEEQLATYWQQVETIRTSDMCFQALLSSYSSLYTEIQNWGTHTTNITLGFVLVLVPGIVLAVNESNLYILLVFPPLFGLLSIFSHLVFIWMSTLSFKMAEIEICFQKAGVPLFNWLTKHNILAPSYNPSYSLIPLIIIGYFFLFVIAGVMTWDYTILRITDLRLSIIGRSLNLKDVVLGVDVSIFLVSGITAGMLLRRYKKIKNKLAQLDNYLSAVTLKIQHE